MEPLKPEVRQAILDANPNAEPGDIEEYERLLAMRFRQPPEGEPPESLAGLRAQPVAPSNLETRLAALHAKLFPGRAQR